MQSECGLDSVLYIYLACDGECVCVCSVSLYSWLQYICMSLIPMLSGTDEEVYSYVS